MDHTYFAFYGSLRKGEGCYNFYRLRLDKKASILGTYQIPGFEMWDAGPYPFVFESKNPQSTIVVDVMEIHDPATIRFIEAMESGAGYEEKTVEVDGFNCTIYVRKRRMSDLVTMRVDCGDWVKYLADKKQLSCLEK